MMTAIMMTEIAMKEGDTIMMKGITSTAETTINLATLCFQCLFFCTTRTPEEIEAFEARLLEEIKENMSRKNEENVQYEDNSTLRKTLHNRFEAKKTGPYEDEEVRIFLIFLEEEQFWNCKNLSRRILQY